MEGGRELRLPKDTIGDSIHRFILGRLVLFYLKRFQFFCFQNSLTPQTHHFIGKDEFKRMKPSAYLVNMARGPVVDEAALVQALKSRSISGAALDVFENEPPSSDNDLFTHVNVILSPHSAALTKEAKEQMSLHAVQGVVDVLEGRNPACWPVNFIS